MPNWNQHNLHLHMSVYASDKQKLGHVAKIYEDSFLVRKGIFFATDRYIPYSAIANIESDQVQLLIDSEEVKDKEWEKRPAYEEHLGDPTQLMYDRGHGVHDPFDETNPDEAE